MKTVTIKFGSVDNATSFVKAIEDFESHFDLIYGQYVVDAKSLLGVMTMDIRNKVDLRIMERENEMPEYVVTVMSSPRTVTVPVWVVIPAGLVIAFIIVFVRKKRAA